MHQQMDRAAAHAEVNPVLQETQIISTPTAVTDVLASVLVARADLCDTQFVVGPNNDVIFALSAIMACHSPAFEAMLPPADGPRRQHTKVALPSVDPASFAAVVSWCHTGRVVLSLATVHGVLAVAEQFQLHRLCNLCRSFAFDNITVETALNVLQSCHIAQDDLLFNKTMAFVCANAAALLKPRLLVESAITSEVLSLILQQDGLVDIPELSLYSLVISWGKLVSLRHDTNLITIVAEPLQHVRYGLIDPERLLAVVKADNLVSSELILMAVAWQINEASSTVHVGTWCTPRVGGALLVLRW
jgi:hypothetical protein